MEQFASTLYESLAESRSFYVYSDTPTQPDFSSQGVNGKCAGDKCSRRCRFSEQQAY